MLLGASAFAVMPFASHANSSTHSGADSRHAPAVASFSPGALHPRTMADSLWSAGPMAKDEKLLNDAEQRERDAVLLRKMYGGNAPPSKDQVIKSIADLQLRARDTSDIMLAEERLGKAVAEASNAQDQATAVSQLQQVVQLAREANVRDSAPMMKKATSLLGLLEQNTKGPPAEVDPLGAKFDAIFAGGYAIPEFDDVPDLLDD